MDIDFIIPAKTNSTRVPNKNWEFFHGGRSLVDITIQHLLDAGADKKRIHISCEDMKATRSACNFYGVNHLQRSETLCDNSVPLTDWIQSIVSQVPGDSDIAWCHVCDPLFDDHAEVIDAWSHAKENEHDSICVVHPMKSYLLDPIFNPIGWQFGEFHTPSQKLPQIYQFPFTMSILTRKTIDRFGYHIGKQPFWYISKAGTYIDIDTKDDWDMCQFLFTEKERQKKVAASYAS